MRSILACLFIVSTISPAFAQETPKLTTAELKEKIETIELLPDTPKRPFKRLMPIQSASLWSMERAVDGLKKQAAKMGADAVIEVQMGKNAYSVTSGSVGGSASNRNGKVVGSSFGSGAEYPTIQGWAIKWTGPEPEAEKPTGKTAKAGK